MSVSGLNLTEEGNLTLFSRNNAVVWQSFDHPTDSLLPGQRMVSGQKLIATESALNLTEGFYLLLIKMKVWFPMLIPIPPKSIINP